MNFPKSKITIDGASVSPISKANSESRSAICNLAATTPNMAELYRATQGAFRSASILRGSASRWSSCPIPSIRQLPTTPIPRPIEPSNRTLPISYIQRHNYSSSRWYLGQTRQTTKEEIKKPDISTYDEDDIFAPEIDFETGELTKNAPEERPELTRPPMRLIPRTGRTIRAGKTVDVARCFKLLEITVKQNKVRHDSFAQRFHERTGKKRKRLKSDRWRRQFRKGFKACVARVRELTKQGW